METAHRDDAVDEAEVQLSHTARDDPAVAVADEHPARTPSLIFEQGIQGRRVLSGIVAFAVSASVARRFAWAGDGVSTA